MSRLGNTSESFIQITKLFFRHKITPYLLRDLEGVFNVINLLDASAT